MDTHAHFHARFLCDRDLDPLRDAQDTWRALEQKLAGFCAEIDQAGIDESDEQAATVEFVKRLGAAGFLRYVVPAQHGGQTDPVGSIAMSIIRQWLARTSGALDTAFIMQGLGSYPIAMAGRPELQARVLPKVADGSLICAFALTEPEAGSDVSGMQTRAHEADGGVRLRGHKCFISNAGIANSYVTFAREGVDGPDGRPVFSAFWVPGDAKGLRTEATQVIAPHPIGEVFFEDVFVPDAHRIGAKGDGLKIALGNLDVFRATVGAAALGLADRALDEAIAHLNTRVQFGKALAKQQGLRFALADLATEHLAAQLLVYRAARARDDGRGRADMPAMGKLYATETAQRVIDRAVQCFGGRGVKVGETVERLYREVRALRIYEGTSEIQKLVIARSLFQPG